MKSKQYEQLKPEQIDFLYETIDENASEKPLVLKEAAKDNKRIQSRECSSPFFIQYYRWIIIGVCIIGLLLFYKNISIADTNQSRIVSRRYPESGTYRNVTLRQEIANKISFKYIKDQFSKSYKVTSNSTQSYITVYGKNADYQIQIGLLSTDDLFTVIAFAECDFTKIKQYFPEQQNHHPFIIITDQEDEFLSEDRIIINIHTLSDYYTRFTVAMLQSFFKDTIHYGMAYELMDFLCTEITFAGENSNGALVSIQYNEPCIRQQLCFELPAIQDFGIEGVDIGLNRNILMHFAYHLVHKYGMNELVSLVTESATDYKQFKIHYEQRMNEWIASEKGTIEFTYPEMLARPCSLITDRETIEKYSEIFNYCEN